MHWPRALFVVSHKWQTITYSLKTLAFYLGVSSINLKNTFCRERLWTMRMFINNFGPKVVPGPSGTCKVQVAGNYHIRKHNRINAWACIRQSFVYKVNIVSSLKHHLGLICFGFPSFLVTRALFQQLNFSFIGPAFTCIFNMLSWIGTADIRSNTMLRTTDGNATSHVKFF